MSVKGDWTRYEPEPVGREFIRGALVGLGLTLTGVAFIGAVGLVLAWLFGATP